MTTTSDRTRADGHLAARTGARAAGRRRDPWFDNAKMALVTLVVIGHSWTLVPETELNNRVYDWLYLWHLPAFLMVTGYLSRSFTYSRRHLRRLTTTVALPYLVFEGLLALFRVHVGGEQLERLWINPHWAMWFLVALVVWRLATPALQRIPYAVPVTIGISLVGGAVSIEALDTNRILSLLPFFTIGLLAERRHLDFIRSRSTRLLGLPVLLAGVLVTGWIEHRLGTEWLYYRTSYGALDTGFVEGSLIRLTLIGIAVAMTVSALAWLPAHSGWFTRMGSASLVVYLFHTFFVKGAEYAGYEEWTGRPVLSLVVVTVAATGVALALAWRPVAKPLEKVVTPDP